MEINYEKLKIAHELLISNDKYYLTWRACQKSCDFELQEYGSDNEWYFDADNIDDLIEKLTELTLTKPKYKEKEFIWVMQEDNRPHHKKILNIRFDTHDKEYICEITNCIDEPYWITEDSLHPTKQALIESQIEYWSSLLDTQTNQPQVDIDSCQESIGKHHELEDEDCQHEKNNFLYSFMGFTHYKCRDCAQNFTKEECQHESDGPSYVDLNYRKHCKKCGGFYR